MFVVVRQMLTIHIKAREPFYHDPLPPGEDLYQMLADVGFSGAQGWDTEDHYVAAGLLGWDLIVYSRKETAPLFMIAVKRGLT